MTVIDMTAEMDALGGAVNLDSGFVLAEAIMAHGLPAVRLDGPVVTMPAPIRVTILDGALSEALDLEESTDTWCWRITIAAPSLNRNLQRYVAVPDSGPVDFGDLVQVDPANLEPVPEGSTFLELLAGKLSKSANLSDLVSASDARDNLGLGSAAVEDSGVFATAAQGALADTAVQPGDASVAVTGDRLVLRDAAGRAKAAAPAAADDLTPRSYVDALSDVIYSVDPRMVRGGDAVALGAANDCLYFRCSGAGTISKVGLEVVVSSGNISVAVYRNSGSGRASVPGTRLATSGAVACPASGYREISLGASVDFQHGDWLALSVDNTTATFRSLLGAGSIAAGLGNGLRLAQTTAHPAPATPSASDPGTGRPIVLVGVP